MSQAVTKELLSECRTALSEAQGAMRGIVDCMPSRTAQGIADICTALIEKIDSASSREPAIVPGELDLAFEIMRLMDNKELDTLQSCHFGFVLRVTREGSAQPPPVLVEGLTKTNVKALTDSPRPMSGPPSPTPTIANDVVRKWLPHVNAWKRGASFDGEAAFAELFAEIERLSSRPATIELRELFDRFEHEHRGSGPDMFEIDRFLTWVDGISGSKPCCGEFDTCTERCRPLISVLRSRAESLRARVEQLENLK